MKPIVLCGPTASGKTELALELARLCGGEIISADSRQVYKRLTVGTAKPEGAWLGDAYRVNATPYHLVDFLDVTETFNAGAFCAKTRELIQSRPQTAFIFAGGTGMYLHSFFVGMDDLPPGTPQTRAELNALLAATGKAGLHAALQAKDPASAAAIPPGNVQRTMRALELCLLTGRKASELKSGHFHRLPDPAQAAFVYISWDKELLNERIARRTEAIFDGMAAEAEQLLKEGYAADIPALKSLGYPQALAFLNGELSRADAVEKIATLTRQYAKRQRTWFNRYTNALKLQLNRPEDFQPAVLAKRILDFSQS